MEGKQPVEGECFIKVMSSLKLKVILFGNSEFDPYSLPKRFCSDSYNLEIYVEVVYITR